MKDKDYINIANISRDKMRITSGSDFFKNKEKVIIKSNHEMISIELATIDYEGKVYTPNNLLSGWVGVMLVRDLPVGKFYFDKDESTNDKAIIYFDQQP